MSYNSNKKSQWKPKPKKEKTSIAIGTEVEEHITTTAQQQLVKSSQKHKINSFPITEDTTDTSLSVNGTDITLSSYPIQSFTRLSESIIWELQKNYYIK